MKGRPAGLAVRIASLLVDGLHIFTWGMGVALVTVLTGMIFGGLTNRVVAILSCFAYASVPFVYLVLYTANSGQTPGKRRFGIRVVRMDGNPAGYTRATARVLASIACSIPLFAGFLLAVAMPGKRALHDYLAGTRVEWTAESRQKGQILLTLFGSLAMVATFTVGYLLYWQFTGLLERSREFKTKANLDMIRGAIKAYSADSQGAYPASLSTDDGSPFSRYLKEMPPVTVKHGWVGAEAGQSPRGAEVAYSADETINLPGNGWRYNPQTGRIFVNSSATDTRGRPYSCYGY